MGGKDKPSVNDTSYLLKKIVVDKTLDLESFSRVVTIFTENGYQVTGSLVNSVMKSLGSVGRFHLCNEVVKIMEESGFVIGSNLQSKIAFHLGSRGNQKEVDELMTKLAASGETVDPKSWAALVEGYSISGNLEEASRCFQQILKKEGGSSAAVALHSLVNGYCHSKSGADAYQLLKDCVTRSDLKPAHPTYKLLIKKSVDSGHFDDALSLLGMMKNNGYPPFLDPLFHHIARKGNGDAAVAFMKAVTSKKLPSSSVFLQMFEAFFKASRHYEAQDFLSKCPRYIRDHADVLNLFYSNSRHKAATKNFGMSASLFLCQ